MCVHGQHFQYFLKKRGFFSEAIFDSCRENILALGSVSCSFCRELGYESCVCLDLSLSHVTSRHFRVTSSGTWERKPTEADRWPARLFLRRHVRRKSSEGRMRRCNPHSSFSCNPLSTERKIFSLRGERLVDTTWQHGVGWGGCPRITSRVLQRESNEFCRSSWSFEFIYLAKKEVRIYRDNETFSFLKKFILASHLMLSWIKQFEEFDLYVFHTVKTTSTW